MYEELERHARGLVYNITSLGEYEEGKRFAMGSV